MDANAVQIEARPGSTFAVTQTCAYEYVCLYSEANQIGWMYSFHGCGFYNLRLINYPGGGNWNDKASSWVDNQTGGMKSTYYNSDGSANWIPIFSESAPSYGNFADYQYDNIIDGVRLC